MIKVVKPSAGANPAVIFVVQSLPPINGTSRLLRNSAVITSLIYFCSAYPSCNPLPKNGCQTNGKRCPGRAQCELHPGASSIFGLNNHLNYPSLWQLHLNAWLPCHTAPRFAGTDPALLSKSITTSRDLGCRLCTLAHCALSYVCGSRMVSILLVHLPGWWSGGLKSTDHPPLITCCMASNLLQGVKSFALRLV